jgi:glutamate formiminotransferase/formiminotetrahydrofolate cyclodeaminase
VRPFLIAYNIYLNTDRVEQASQIARAVRHTGGGLREVQALGFLVEGQAQVSMNLTDFNVTPVYRAQELVRREAARYGLSIARAELVGLIPQKALHDAARWYLQLDDLTDDQILEMRLAQEAEADYAPHALLEATASSSPTPGGGSAAAAAGALAAALAQMVAGLTTGRKKYAAAEGQSQHVLRRAAELREQLTLAIHEDAASFEALMAAMRDKELDESSRAAAIQSATRHAAEVPLRVSRLAGEVAELALGMARQGNANAVSDAAAGVFLARSAVEIAAMNVRINAVSVTDRDVVTVWMEELAALEAQVARAAQEAQAIGAERGGFAA